jgi:hypothetical protein
MTTPNDGPTVAHLGPKQGKRLTESRGCGRLAYAGRRPHRGLGGILLRRLALSGILRSLAGEAGWCGWSDLNRHGGRPPTDFKSVASTDFATPAAERIIPAETRGAKGRRPIWALADRGRNWQSSGRDLLIALQLSEIQRITSFIEYRFGSVALHACSSDRAPESSMILSENLIVCVIWRARTLAQQGQRT